MKKIGLAIIAIGILIGGYFAFETFMKKPRKIVDGVDCTTETQEYVVPDEHMAGILETGATVSVIMNYYKCNEVERGDVVLYRFSSSISPVPRIVRALPGEPFKLSRDKIHTGWNIEINGDLLMDKQEPHYFGSAPPPLLSLYEKNGKLSHDTVLVFSNVSPGNYDSGTFGVVNIQDLIGKVIMHPEDASAPNLTPKPTITPDPAQTENIVVPEASSIPATPRPKSTKPISKPKSSVTPKPVKSRR